MNISQSTALIQAASFAARDRLPEFMSVISSEWTFFTENPKAPCSALSLLLAFLPEAVDPGVYVNLIYTLAEKLEVVPISWDSLVIPPIGLPDQVVHRRALKLIERVESDLEKLGWKGDSASGSDADSTVSLEDWVIIRTRQIDRCSGNLYEAKTLFDHPDCPDRAEDWFYGIAQVMISYRELYLSKDEGLIEWLGIDDLENRPRQVDNEDISDSPVTKLLAHTTPEVVVRDFQTLISPYLSYMKDWALLWTWFAHTGVQRLDLLVPLSNGVLGDAANNLALARALISACYLCETSSLKTLSQVSQIYTGLSEGELQDEGNDLESHLDSAFSPDHFFSFPSLFQSPLVVPTLSNLKTLDALSTSTSLLFTYISDITVKELALTKFFGSEQDQKALVLKVLNASAGSKTRDDKQATQIRDALRWLKSKSHVLGRVSDTWLDEVILDSCLKSASKYLIHSQLCKHF